MNNFESKEQAIRVNGLNKVLKIHLNSAKNSDHPWKKTPKNRVTTHMNHKIKDYYSLIKSNKITYNENFIGVPTSCIGIRLMLAAMVLSTGSSVLDIYIWTILHVSGAVILLTG